MLACLQMRGRGCSRTGPPTRSKSLLPPLHLVWASTSLMCALSSTTPCPSPWKATTRYAVLVLTLKQAVSLDSPSVSSQGGNLKACLPSRVHALHWLIQAVLICLQWVMNHLTRQSVTARVASQTQPIKRMTYRVCMIMYVYKRCCNGNAVPSHASLMNPRMSLPTLPSCVHRRQGVLAETTRWPPASCTTAMAMPRRCATCSSRVLKRMAPLRSRCSTTLTPSTAW